MYLVPLGAVNAQHLLGLFLCPTFKILRLSIQISFSSSGQEYLLLFRDTDMTAVFLSKCETITSMKNNSPAPTTCPRSVLNRTPTRLWSVISVVFQTAKLKHPRMPTMFQQSLASVLRLFFRRVLSLPAIVSIKLRKEDRSDENV